MKLLAVTSGKGGTGKSCVAAYTGIALAKEGSKTLLVEMGASFRSLDLIVGLQEQVVFDINDVLGGECEAEKAIISSEQYENLHLLPAGFQPVSPLQGEKLLRLLGSLAAGYDYIILDGVDFETIPAGRLDMVLMVATPDSLSIRACAQQASGLYDAGVKNMRLVINNVPARVLPMYGAGDFDDVIDIIGVQLIAVIPTSPKLQYSSNNAQALDQESITVKIFENLAGRIKGKKIPLLIR